MSSKAGLRRSETVGDVRLPKLRDAILTLLRQTRANGAYRVIWSVDNRFIGGAVGGAVRHDALEPDRIRPSCVVSVVNALFSRHPKERRRVYLLRAGPVGPVASTGQLRVALSSPLAARRPLSLQSDAIPLPAARTWSRGQDHVRIYAGQVAWLCTCGRRGRRRELLQSNCRPDGSHLLRRQRRTTFGDRFLQTTMWAIRPAEPRMKLAIQHTGLPAGRRANDRIGNGQRPSWDG